MLQISRKLFALPLNQVYFQELKCDSRYEPKLISYTHVLKPSRKLQGKSTLHINLTLDEPTLFYRLSEKVINLLDEIHEESWTISRINNPTDQDIEEYHQFYNLNSRQKDARKLNKYDIQTLKLLRDQGGLVITKIENEQKAVIYYRIYAVGLEMVMELYSEGQGVFNDRIEQCANYFLCWQNIKYFSKQGYQIYDFGDIKDLTLLEELKEGFGGKLVTVFSGYISKSPFSQLLLQFNLKGLKKRLSY
ncbi:hypothetical protein LG296_14670 [Ureibacillus chungkukjangi]|uniref:hypothetical protein n=1 Tax=Ureibacillus chungkukjangi TaxID=1202712 RepID=UPI00384EBD3D